MMIKRLLLPFSFLLILHSGVQAQQLLGLTHSNYSGMHGIYSNPAAIADSRFRFSVNLFSFDANASNTYVRYNGPTSIFKSLRNGDEIKEEHLEVVSSAKPKLFTSSVDVRGPSFMFTMGPKHSLAVSSRVRGAMQMNNVSEEIADLIKTGGDSEELMNRVNRDNEMSLNSNVQAELGLTYARQLYNSGPHYIKGGATVKKLTGIYSAHFINRNTSFQVEEQYDPADPTSSDVVVKIDNIELQYGYLNDDLLQNIDATDVVNWLTKGDAPGQGWGADLGFSYEFRPNMEQYHYSANGKDYIDRQHEKYKFRFSMSLMDVGKIRYDKAGMVKSFDLKKTNKEIQLKDFEDAEDTEDITQVLNESLDVQPSESESSFSTGLPTALHLDLDYKLAGPFYINASWVHGLRGNYAIAMRQNSLLALTPRLDTKGLTLAFPLSLHNNYQVFALGGLVKVGPFFVGSDNIGGAFNIGKPYGANVYTGLNFSIGQAKKKDKKVKKNKSAAPATQPQPSNQQ